LTKISEQIDGMRALAKELDDFDEYKKRLLSEYGIDWDNPNNNTDNYFIAGVWHGAKVRQK